MAQSYLWLSLAEASSLLGIPEYQALDLAVAGRIASRLKHDHRELSAVDVEDFVSELAAHEGDDLAENAKPTVRGGPHIGDNAEREFTASQADYDDTPTDEGDEN